MSNISIKKVILFLFMFSALCFGSENNKKDDSITLIVDYSSSMKGENFNAAQNSSVTLIEMISLWDKMFPNKVNNLKLQYIVFGGKSHGKEEIRVIHKLDRIKDYNALKQEILNSRPEYNATNYYYGFREAISSLKNGNYNNKTIFITDGKDEDTSQTKDNFELLGDTKFILFGKHNLQNNWQQRIPNSVEYRMENEYGVASLFLMTLFEYLDDINKYLVRRGTYKTEKGIFKTIKNSDSEEQLLVLLIPDKNIELAEVKSGGNIIPKDNYEVYKGDTFIHVKLKRGVSAGEYELSFKNGEAVNRYEYVSFEKSDIHLKLKSPAEGQKVIEGSTINYDFKYFDNNSKKEINYPDFIENVYYKTKIGNGSEKNGKGVNGLISSGNSRESGAAMGSNTALSGWGYNSDKIGTLEEAGTFIVDKEGILVKIEYDKNQLWEGRDLELKGELEQKSADSAKVIKAIKVKMGDDREILLEQSESGKNSYNGIIKNLKAGTYQINIQGCSSVAEKQYNLGIDSATNTTLDIQKRAIKVDMDVPSNMGASLSGEKSTFGDKLKYLFRKIGKERISFLFKENNENKYIDYALPYAKGLKEKMDVKLGYNKIFEDEKCDIKLEYEPKKENYYILNGAGNIEMKANGENKAVKVEFGDSAVKELKNETETVDTYITIDKGNDKVNYKKILYKEPTIRIIGKIIGKNGAEINFDNRVTYNIKTSQSDFLQFALIDGFMKFLIGLLILILLLIIVIVLITKKMRFLRKVKEWKEIKENSIEDFYDDLPASLKKSIEKIEDKSVFTNEVQNIDSITIKRRKCKKYVEDEKTELVVKRLNLKEIKQIRELGEKKYRSDWKFYFDMAKYSDIKITRDEADRACNAENCIRVRLNFAKDYGKIEFGNNKAYFIPGNISLFVKNKNDEYVMQPTRFEVMNRTMVYFGVNERDLKFSVYFEVEAYGVKMTLKNF